MRKIMHQTRVLLFVCFAMVFAVPASAQIIKTVAGGGSSSGDGGPAVSAQLNAPIGVAVDNAGNLFIAEMLNARIRRVDAATQVITTVAGTGTHAFSVDGGPATSTELYAPYGIAFDPAGNLLIADGFPFLVSAGDNRIRRVDAATQIMTTAAGSPGPHACSKCVTFSGDGGPATSAELNRPFGVAVDGAGNLFIADFGNSRIRRVDAATHVINTVVGTQGFGFSGDGGLAASATLAGPADVAVDGEGNLFIADSGNSRIRRVDAATQVITTVAGNGTGGFSGDGGPATAAKLAGPGGVAVDAAGNLFIVDSGNSRIRRVDAATQVITTVAGNGTYGFSGDGGPATAAELAFPTGIAVDRVGNLFIADPINNRIREVVASQDTTPPVTTATASPGPNTNGWNNTNVTVSLNSTDSESGGSGVKQIQYALTGAQSVDTQTVPASAASVTISAEGMTTLNYFGTDNAGNAEQSKALTVQIDKTPPVVSGMPASGCALWPPNGQMVQVATVTAADALSGVAPGSFQVTGSSSEPSDPNNPDVVLTPNGSGGYVIQLRARRLGSGTGRIYTLQATATDLAGNTITSTATCSVPHSQSTAAH